MEYLFVISAAFAFLFFLLLISKRQKRQEHWFLASIFLLVTVNSVFVFLFAKRSNGFYLAGFSEVNFALPMLYGTLFWFYTKSIVQSQFRFSYRHIWHFVPFGLFLLWLLLPLISSIQLPITKLLGYPLIKLIVNPIYLFAILVLLSRYRKDIMNHVSNTDKVNLLWLDWITVGAIILWLIALVGYIYSKNTTAVKPLLTDYVILCFLAFYLFALAFIAFKKTDLFKQENLPYVRNADLDIAQEISEKQSVDAENFDGELSKLIKLMESDQAYLDSQLTLYSLSDLSGIPQYRLSKALNNTLKQNFFEFVNSYRVKHVKKMIDEGMGKQMNLLGIAMDSGFNSKASFNRIFKKIEGMTPSQYLKGSSKIAL